MEGLFLEIFGSRPQFGLMMLQGLGLGPTCLGMSGVIYVSGMPQRVSQTAFLCGEVKPVHAAAPNLALAHTRSIRCHLVCSGKISAKKANSV